MSTTLLHLTEICKRLNEAGVRYVVVGGFAIVLHGYERTTRDVDLLVDSATNNIEKIKEALKELLPEACAELTPDDVLKNVVVRMAGEEIVVDLLGRVGEIDYPHAGIEEVEIDGVTIPFADLDTMLELKSGMRERDKRDYLFLKGKKEYLLRSKKK